MPRIYHLLVCLVGAIAFTAACDDGSVDTPDTASLHAEDTQAGVLTFALGSIWQVNADGSVLAQLVPKPGAGDALTSPTFSPNGERIAYILNNRQVLVADAASASDPDVRIDLYTDLSVPGTASDWSLGPRAVHWSPGGEWLLVTRQRCCGSGISDVMLVRPDGTDLHTIIDSSRLPSFPEATWSESTAPDPQPPPSIIVVGGGDGLSGVSYDLGGGQISAALPIRALRYALASFGNPYGEGALVTSALGSPEPFGPIEVIDITGTSAIVGGGCGATWAPDGRHIAYYDGFGIVIQEIGASPDDAVQVVSNADLFIKDPDQRHEEVCNGFSMAWRAS